MQVPPEAMDAARHWVLGMPKRDIPMTWETFAGDVLAAAFAALPDPPPPPVVPEAIDWNAVEIWMLEHGVPVAPGVQALNKTSRWVVEWVRYAIAETKGKESPPMPGDNCGCQFSENGAMCGAWPIVNIVAGMPVCARHSPPHLNDAVRDDVSREHSAPSRQRLIETCKRATEPKATGMSDDFRALAHALLDWLEAGQ